MIHLSQAIESLRPGAKFVMRGNDIENIEWETDGVKPLTTAEVHAEVSRLGAIAEEEKAKAARASAAAIAHAKSLGFTDEMISVMYPALSE